MIPCAQLIRRYHAGRRYVPMNYAHAVLNLEDSIAVAAEMHMEKALSTY